MGIEEIAALIQSILMFLFVIFLAIGSLKFLAKYFNGDNGLIKIIEKKSVDNNSSLVIAKVGEEYFLMGAGNSGVTILRDLDLDLVEKITREKPIKEGVEFKTIGKFLKKFIERGNQGE